MNVYNRVVNSSTMEFGYDVNQIRTISEIKA